MNPIITSRLDKDGLYTELIVEASKVQCVFYQRTHNYDYYFAVITFASHSISKEAYEELKRYIEAQSAI